MYECRGDDDARPETPCEQVCVQRHAEPWDPLRHDGEDGGEGRYEANYEDGGDAGAEVAVVFVCRASEVACYVAGVGGCEVYGVGIGDAEVGGHD